MAIFNGMIIGADTYEAIGRNTYSVDGVGLTDPQHTIKVNPGTISNVRKGSAEKRRIVSWVVTDEFEIASPSTDQPSRQRCQVTVTVSAGYDVPEASINDSVDRSAMFPDSGRLNRALRGGA